MKNKARFEVLLPPELLKQARESARARGFTSVNAFIRAAVQNELRHGETALEKAERILAASIERLSRDVRSLQTTQQACFAMTDSLARLVMTCVPEPPPEVLDQAKRRAKLRYDRFIRSVAQSMTGEPDAVLSEMKDRG